MDNTAIKLCNLEVLKFFSESAHIDENNHSLTNKTNTTDINLTLNVSSLTKSNQRKRKCPSGPSAIGPGSDTLAINEKSKKRRVTPTPEFFLSCHPNIIYPGEETLHSLDGTKWSAVPENCNAQARNIVHIVRGPKGEARHALTPFQCFSLFLTPDMTARIADFTNTEMKRIVGVVVGCSEPSMTCHQEVDALVGLLILQGLKKNISGFRDLFDFPTIEQRFEAAMSAQRFDLLLTSLAFDSPYEGQEKHKDDLFAPVRDMWEEFLDKCASLYDPGPYVSMGDMVLNFPGLCPFRTFSTATGYKHGVKIYALCDAETKYLISAAPYLGKHMDTNGDSMADYFIKKLIPPIMGTNRNISMSNWFTSMPMAVQLVQPPNRLTIVGHITKNVRSIPDAMIGPSVRQAGGTMFCFDREKTLLSYQPTTTAVITLLSTFYDDVGMNPQTGKPEMFEFYESTIGAVDKLDKMCTEVSCSRKTVRWPLCVFYRLINLALVNAYVIYCHNTRERSEKPISRRAFNKEVSEEIMKPWLLHRLSLPEMKKPLKNTIALLLGVELIEVEDERPLALNRALKSNCFFCYPDKKKPTKNSCICCHRRVCSDHKGGLVCGECINNRI